MVQKNGRGFFFFCSFITRQHEITCTLWTGIRVTSMEALFVVARNTLDPFKQLMTEFVKNAGLDPDAIVMHKGKPLMNEDIHGPWRVLNVAPPKGETPNFTCR